MMNEELKAIAAKVRRLLAIDEHYDNGSITLMLSTDEANALRNAAEVARLTGELDAASARLHEVATLCATVEQERDRLTGELEKETAHSKHLAGAVSRKIEELIAVENQCGYYRMQYSRAEQVRKEACEANVKAQAAMLWLEAELERSRHECERLREEVALLQEALERQIERTISAQEYTDAETHSAMILLGESKALATGGRHDSAE